MTHEPDKYASAIRARLGKLAEIGAKAEASAHAIQDAAEKRLTEVEADIEKLRQRALLDDEVGDKFQDLLLERGRLRRVMARDASMAP